MAERLRMARDKRPPHLWNCPSCNHANVDMRDGVNTEHIFIINSANPRLCIR